MRGWWKRVVTASLSSTPPLFLLLPFDPSPLHQTQLISAVLLSCSCQLQKAGSWVTISPRVTRTCWPLIPGGELITGNDALHSLHHVHLTASISTLCKSLVLRHVHHLFSQSYTLEKQLLTQSHFHKLTIFLLCFHGQQQRASIGKSGSLVYHCQPQVLCHTENSNPASHTCCHKAPDCFKYDSLCEQNLSV